MKGRYEYRLKDNPMEQRFAEEWKKQETVGHTLEYLLSSRINEREAVDEHDQEVAATVIQWLGSPVGLAFLEDVLGVDIREQIYDRLRS